MLPTIIAYFTLGTGYAEEVKQLQETLRIFASGFRSEIVGIPNLGSWEANTHYKPLFIRQCLLDLKGPVIYLDADSVFHDKPKAFLDIPQHVSFGCCYFDWGHQKELSGAVLYFSYSPIAIDILNKWNDKCKEFPQQFDQKLLQEVVEQDMQISPFIFPKEYDVIFDLHKHIKNPVIIQMQASRRLKKGVKIPYNKENTDEMVLCNLHVGKPALILGKGNSLNELGDIDFKKFAVFGMNDIGKVFPRVDELFYFDAITWGENRKLFDRMQKAGTRFWTTHCAVGHKHLRLLQQDQPYGWEPGKFFHSYTSAYWALQMAYWAGCKEIYLAGIDLKVHKNGDYFDGSSAREGKAFQAHLDKMRKGFEIAAGFQLVDKFRVYRISGYSTLDFFPVRHPKNVC